MSTLNVRTLLIILGSAGSILVLVLGVIGSLVTGHVAEQMGEVAVLEKAQRNQLEADMYHEGIQGSVRGVMLALGEGNQAALAQSAKELQERITRIGELLGENRKLSLGAEIAEHQARLAPAVERMNAAAGDIGRLAASDAAAARARVTEFEQAFKVVEEVMEKGADAIEEAAHRVQADQERTLAAAQTAQWAVTLLALAVILPLSIYVTRRIAAPLADLTAAARAVARDRDLTRRAAAAGGDEFAETTRAFNQLLADVQAMVVEVQSKAEAVNTEAASIAGASGQSLNAIVAQGDATSEVAAAVEQLSSSIRGVADSAGETHRATLGTRDASADGRRVVQEAMAEMQRLSQVVTESIAQIRALAERSQEITGIIRVIREIADQTNLLALNAAIEAARAGESGRGFAVVADEVRKLAERAAGATEEISRVIDAIAGETGRTVEVMHKAGEEAGRAVGHAGEVGQVLTRIAETVAGLAARSEDITHATQEQVVAVETIEGRAARIAAMGEQSRAAVSGAARGAEALRGLSEAMKAAAGRFRV